MIKRIIGRINWEIEKRQTAREEKRKEEADARERMGFYGEFIRQGDLFFDVGANKGNRVAPMLLLGAQVIAIEPQQECVDILEEKFKGQNLKIVQKGIAAQAGTMTMNVANVNTITSFSEEWIQATRDSGRFSQYDWSTKREVEMVTLDALIELFGKPTFIKIDVEGFELEVLKGLSKPVYMTSVEYTTPEQTDKLVACLERLQLIHGEAEVLTNYSIGEGMTWATDKWIPFNEMIAFVQTEEFIQTGFGDVYVLNQAELQSGISRIKSIIK